MHYYVISPNVWNDGNIEPHVNFMSRNHVVCIGWDQDHTPGWNFSHKIQMGDYVIVAQRKNWKWTVFFAGIVDSPARYGDETGNHYTMCRDIRAFVDLRKRNGGIEFKEGMTGYSRKNPGALFQLHQENDADAKFIQSVENLLLQADKKLSFSIREISNWGENGRVAIPSLQRGLVWNPMQVELLWDSILRGFPIGAFVFSDATKESKQRTSETLDDVQYFLLDGQQRANAIALAFERNKQSTRLWADLLPEMPSTRRFMVKATTQAHPWGFRNDNECSTLSAQDIRNAIHKFTGKTSSEIRFFDISELDPMGEKWRTWPIAAGCPIPLARLLNFFDFYGYAYEPFKNRIIKLVEDSPITRDIPLTPDNSAKLEAEIIKWYYALYELTEYRINANLLPQRTIETEDGDALIDEVTKLESLFTRLNTMGSRISPYDLRYSAIKAYWGEIKEENDRIAKTIMPGAHLAIFAFRLALTIAGEESKTSAKSLRMADVPTISRIRKLGLGVELDKVEERARALLLGELYKGRLLQIVNEIEIALGVYKSENGNIDGLPPFLRTSIVSNSPDVYLFLMVLAYHNLLAELTPSFTCALATYVHWMNLGPKKNIVDNLFSSLYSNGYTAVNLERAFREQVETKLLPLVPLNLSIDEDGRLSAQWSQPVHSDFYSRLENNKELLIFAERIYFNRNFKYDPARIDLNKGHNKPWDYDHIIPQEWTHNKKVGDYRQVCKDWTWTIGNLAAIPFSINRSKSNEADWAEYLENAEELLIEKNKISQVDRWAFVRRKDQAILFCSTTAARLERIYECWRSFVIDALDLPANTELHEQPEEHDD